MRTNKRSARAVRTYEHVRVIRCKTRTWNYHNYGFDNVFDSIMARTPAYFANFIECEYTRLLVIQTGQQANVLAMISRINFDHVARVTNRKCQSGF